MRVYPVLLKLEGQRAVVVGGGPVAQRKVRTLLRAGAEVTVVSPQVTPGLARLARSGRIRHRRQRYAPGILRGAFLVIGATDDEATQRRIAHDAAGRGLLCNLASLSERSNFLVPASFSRGDVVVAFSTGGASPALARKLRQELERTVGREYGILARWLSGARRQIIRALPTERERARAFRRLVDPRVLRLLRSGRRAAAQARFRRLLRQALD